MSGVSEATASAPDSALAVLRRPSSSYRGDIDGLRALCVVLVVAFHADLPFVTGGFVGVDVFFVISGYLITGLLLDEQRASRLSLAGFYARRVRRLLPLSALVLVATAAAAAVLSAPLTHAQTADDIGSAALYVSNWHFAFQATDYMAADVNGSPVLHYWSLSVEEQYYIVWPLLILAAVAVRRIGSLRLPGPTARVGIVLATLGVGSWFLSAMTTGSNGPLAYYGTQTRAWELAAGAGLAMARPVIPGMRRLPVALGGWAGLALVVGSAFVFTRQTPFPGVAATAPVLGAVLVLLAGARVADVGVARPLSNRRLQYVGRISYAWYLWHWPFIVLMRDRFAPNGRPQALITSLAVVLSFGAAVVTHRILENPVRRSAWLAARRRRSLLLGLGLTMVSVLAAIELARFGSADTPLAQPVVALRGGAPVTMRMTPSQARAPVQGMRDCHVTEWVREAAADCTFGDPAAKVTVALIGDSHAQQWFPAMQALAVQNHWKLLVWTKDACLFIDLPIWTDAYARHYTECEVWRASVTRKLASAGHLDAVVIAATAYYRYLTIGGDGKLIPASSTAKLEAAWAAGSAKTFAALRPVTDHIVIMKDNPQAPSDIPACLSAAGADAESCAFPRADGDHGAGLDVNLVAAERSVAPPDVAWLDMTDDFCTATVCPAVDKNGLIIYRNYDHLTVAEVTSLTTSLGARLALIMAGSG